MDYKREGYSICYPLDSFVSSSAGLLFRHAITLVINSYAAGGKVGPYKSIQTSLKITESLAHWYSADSISEIYPMNTNIHDRV